MRQKATVSRYHSRRHGAVYVYVLATSLLVTVVGLSVLTATQINNRITRQSNEGVEGETLAESAVEFALTTLSNDSNWRNNYTNGLLTIGKALGHGTISFKLIDEIDGNFTNNTTDPVRLYGVGQANNTTKIYSVQLSPATPPLSCLQVPVDSLGTITLSTAYVSGSGTLASNTYISGSGTLNTISLESGGLIVYTGSGTGSRTQNATARAFPDGTTVFSQYTSAALGASTVNFSSLPISGSPAMPTIDHKLICPASTPWALTNTKGIYIFNCGGNSVNITNSRVVGTLVFLNANTVYLQTSDIFEPAVTNYPVLLVQGNLQISNTSASITEGSPTPAVNFNPSGTPIPYLGGSNTNGSTSDSFASSLTGLFYATGNITISNQPVIKGAVIAGGTLSSTGTLSLTYNAVYYNSPPPAFTGGGTLSVVSGTWRWETAP